VVGVVLIVTGSEMQGCSGACPRGLNVTLVRAGFQGLHMYGDISEDTEPLYHVQTCKLLFKALSWPVCTLLNMLMLRLGAKGGLRCLSSIEIKAKRSQDHGKIIQRVTCL
jgi:hypothetical protein